MDEDTLDDFLDFARVFLKNVSISAPKSRGRSGEDSFWDIFPKAERYRRNSRHHLALG
jgi:hypothetical protein